ncbi:hypothetical protein GGP99_003437 [Salinibacter ruber]|uniref:Carboxypeptidase regulatory-like domain-containing protein n=1 Tax=Salinibacter ruber TaxID=146919 RepID=A0AAW5PCX4_9BACT|nr:hypothetical protein [Salinibacter ruber]
MRGAHDLSPSKSNPRRLPWAIRAGNRSGSACCSPHRRTKCRAAQRQRVRPGRRDVSRRRVLPGATGQLVDTQIGTAPHSDGPYRIEEIPTGPYDLRVRLGGWRHHSPPSRSGPEPNRPAALPPCVIAAKAPSSRRRSGLQALEDVPVVLSGGQRVRPGWRARPQVARARRGSRPLRLLRALRGLPRKVAPERQPLSDFASGRPTSNGSLCQLLSAKAPVFSPSRGRPHRCRCHGCRCPYCC